MSVRTVVSLHLDDFPPALDSVRIIEPSAHNVYPLTTLMLGGVTVHGVEMTPHEIADFLAHLAAQIRTKEAQRLDKGFQHTCSDGEWCERCELEDRIHEHATEVQVEYLGVQP